MLDDWLAPVQTEEAPPNKKQLATLYTIRDRIVLEEELNKEGSKRCRKRWTASDVDEIFMIPDELLGTFANHLQEAAAESSRYTKRADGSTRIFGGYNFLMFGDMNQIAPIPAKAALFKPPVEKKTSTARKALDIFWSNGPDALNFYQELIDQMRIDDVWYNAFLMECRAGALSEEMYNFLMGFPTEHAGSWMPRHASGGERLLCQNEACEKLPARWRGMASVGSSWAEMQGEECNVCSAERARRNRLIEADDVRVRRDPFLSAP